MSKILAILTILWSTTVFAQDQKSFTWPDFAKSAVCLTYDDATASHLNIAIPDLEKYNFRGTFYISAGFALFGNQLEKWRRAAKDGHELGNHTLFHPCLENTRGEHRDWLNPAYRLETYSITRIVDELRSASTLLEAVDGNTRRSFAYTCCDTHVGNGESFIDFIRPLFPCARGGGETFPSLRETDLMNVPSFAVINHSGDQMIIWVKQAMAENSMIVFMFHGIDETDLPVTRQAHGQLLEYLDQNRKDIWTAPFLEVMTHVEKERRRLGW
ncbi:polysaccharide deacetylase family protein [candidate division KSB1 bacterium]|nr:polysaccharide deacetylase family protein [candidate division KSB1 bacterium]